MNAIKGIEGGAVTLVLVFYGAYCLLLFSDMQSSAILFSFV